MILTRCQTQVATMFKFSYFENTPISSLAKAVEREDSESIIGLASKKNIDINFKESVYVGNTLLITAVSNGKVKAIRTLLEVGADVNSINNAGQSAITVACNHPSKEKHSYEIIRLLLEFGANPNQIEHGTGDRKGYITTPLTLAIEDRSCANLLLQKGANLYFKFKNTYLVWDRALRSSPGDGILLLRDLIVKKKMQIPVVISYDVEGKPNDIFSYLAPEQFVDDPFETHAKAVARNQIETFLKKISFPAYQSFSDTTSFSLPR
jgi:hypothetical protein